MDRNCADCGPQPEDNFYDRKPYPLSYCKRCHCKRATASVMKRRALNEAAGRPRTYRQKKPAEANTKAEGKAEEFESRHRLKRMEEAQQAKELLATRHPEPELDDSFPKQSLLPRRWSTY